MRQRDRHHHEAGSDQRRHELPGLTGDRAVIRIDPGEIRLRRQHAQTQHQHAAQSDSPGGRGYGEVGLAPAADRLHRRQPGEMPQQPAAAQQDLIAGEQGAREEQRDHIVVEAKDEDGPDDVRRADIGFQPKQHGGVEHADAAGKIGGQAGGVTGYIDAQEDQPGQPGRVGQQGVEDRGGRRDVDRGQQHLDDCHAPAGKLDLVAKDPHALEDPGQCYVAEHHGPQQDADAVHGELR